VTKEANELTNEVFNKQISKTEN